jgi:hypothetical protein
MATRVHLNKKNINLLKKKLIFLKKIQIQIQKKKNNNNKKEGVATPGDHWGWCTASPIGWGWRWPKGWPSHPFPFFFLKKKSLFIYFFNKFIFFLFRWTHVAILLV